MFARFLIPAACALVAIPVASRLFAVEDNAAIGSFIDPGRPSSPSQVTIPDPARPVVDADPVPDVAAGPAVAAPDFSTETYVPERSAGRTDVAFLSDGIFDWTGGLGDPSGALDAGPSRDPDLRDMLSLDGIFAFAPGSVSAMAGDPASATMSDTSAGVAAAFGDPGATPAVTPVPLPPASLPLLGAVCLLGVLRRRRT